MVSNTLKNNFKYLEILSKIPNNSLRKNVISDLNIEKEIYNCMSEICKNIIIGNINLSKNEKLKLRPYKKLIVSLAAKNHNNKNKSLSSLKRKLIYNQSGTGLFSILIPIAATALFELFKSKK